LRNLYIVPRAVARGEAKEQVGEAQAEQGHGFTIFDSPQCPAPGLRLRLADKAVGFLDGLLAEPGVGAAFLLPTEEGYAAHSGFMVDRLAGSVYARSPQSFLAPGAKVVPFRSHESTTSNTCGTLDDLRRALEAAIGGFCFSAGASVAEIELDLDQRLSFPWLLREPPRERRVCVVLDPVSPSVTRARWEGAAALGVKVVVLSSGSWWATGSSDHGYQGWDHLREAFVSIDLTPDAQLWQRIVQAVRSYRHPIDGIFTPTDTYLVSVARAAQALGLFTNGPQAYATSTDKSLTRKLLDPDSTKCFAVLSLSELDIGLASAEPVSFPVVCKPSFGRGSEGVFKAGNAAELRHVVAKSLEACCGPHPNGVLVEPYVDGPEVDANLVLRDGRLLYAEVVDDFPSPAELDSHAQSANGALFIETQAVAPSRLPREEQDAIIAKMMEVIRLQGFHTGVFHCEARVRNSRMEYVLAPGTSIPDLQPRRAAPGAAMLGDAEQPAVFLHEVNARVPGTMSSAASLVARGIDFWGLQVLCAVGDWERYEAFTKPFPFSDECMNHVVLTNVVLHVSLRLVQHTFPGLSPGELNRQFVDGDRDPMRELARRHPEIMQHVVRHNTIVKSRQAYGGRQDEWLWGAFVVLCSPRGRRQVLDVADRLMTAYEAIVRAADEALSHA
jgi:biotin carboxylase